MRQKVYRPMILVIVLTALLLSLSACGGKKNDDAASESAAAAPVEAAAALVGDPAAGEKVYQVSCVACHGPDARGVAGLGKSLHPEDSNFISERTDAELVEYIKVGRRVDDPLNTTGIDMPP